MGTIEEEARKELATRKAELEVLIKRAQSDTEHNTLLDATVERLSTELKAATTRASAAETRVHELDSAIIAAGEEHGRDAARLAGFEREVAELTERIAKLDADHLAARDAANFGA
jgi:chromosome segregation ATPase